MTEYDKCSEGYDMLQKYFEVKPREFRHSNLFMHCGISTKVFDVTKISNTKLLINILRFLFIFQAWFLIEFVGAFGRSKDGRI